VVADVEHFRRPIAARKLSGEVVLVGEAVEAAAAHHDDAERIGAPAKLGRHAGRLANHG
jgi:hypothetical protein